MKTFAYAAAAALALATAPAVAQDWNATQVETEAGHLLGNPEAEVKLIEFISYTCGHCANYTHDADAVLQLQYIPTGRVNVEVRPFIRNRVDMAVALLAQCGPDNRFFVNHRTLLARQESWLEKATQTTPAQRARWESGSFGSQMRAIASDLGLYAIMEQRGYTISEMDACLTDMEQASAIMDSSRADRERWDIPGTPSFALNGQMLDGIHTWPQVQAALDNALTTQD